MRHWVSFIASALVFAGCATSNPVERTPLEDQLALFLDWFPGRYDSAAQVLRDTREGTAEAERNYRRHSIFRQVELPAFGKTVFLAHQYRDGDPAKVYRQRLYTFTLDEAENAFRLRVHVPKDADALKGAYRNPSRLAGLTLEDFTVWEGCDLFWQLENGRFVGRLKPGACRFNSKAFGQEIVLDETLTLMEDQIWFADRGLSLSGDYLFGMRGTTPNMSLKARPFICEDGKGTAWLHDQGGMSKALGYRIKLERLNQADEAGQAVGLRLTVPMIGRRDLTVLADHDAETLAIDVGPDRLSCRHAPDTLYSENS